MNEQEVGIVYDKSPVPSSGQREEQDEGVKFRKYLEEQESKKADVSVQSESIPSEEAPGIDYPSTPAGFEEVYIQQPSDLYPNSPPSFQNMKLKDAVGFVKAEIGKSFEQGNYGILDHYQMVAEQSEFVDDSVRAAIRSLGEEGKKITNKDEAKAFLEKLNVFLNGLRTEWKK